MHMQQPEPTHNVRVLVCRISSSNLGHGRPKPHTTYFLIMNVMDPPAAVGKGHACSMYNINLEKYIWSSDTD